MFDYSSKLLLNVGRMYVTIEDSSIYRPRRMSISAICWWLEMFNECDDQVGVHHETPEMAGFVKHKQNFVPRPSLQAKVSFIQCGDQPNISLRRLWAGTTEYFTYLEQ